MSPGSGRPASWAPVWKNVIAGSWLIASVCSDLMKHSSSATRAVCGSSSLIHAPVWPCCVNLNIEAATGKRALRGSHARESLTHANGVGQLAAVQAPGSCGL